MVTLASSAAPTPNKMGSSSQDSGPSSVPFRGSSVPKSRRSKPSSSTSPASSTASASSYTTWLLLDADDRALPFVRTLHQSSSATRSDLASGPSSPAATSSEKLTESTNTAASRVVSVGSNVRSQASKYENGTEKDTDKDRRMSLPHHAGNAASTGRKGFMSRLRGTGGSVSSATGFNAPQSAAPISTSGSWSIVDSPIPTKEQLTTSKSSLRTVHLAFTTMADRGATTNAQGLVGKASPSLLSTQETRELAEQLHPNRLDAAGLSNLISATNSEAIYIGSARPASTTEALRSYLEELLTSTAASSLKFVLIEPAAVRQLTPPQASSLYDLARSRSITLLLPIRWNSLWTASIEETLLALEILHDLQDEEAQFVQHTASGDADVSVEKSFDVSMSNIPTGLSSDRLDKMAELEALKTQLGQLQRELGNRDRRIGELSKQVEEGQKQIQLQQQQQNEAVVETLNSKLTSTGATAAEPKTPVRSAAAAAAFTGQAVTPAALGQSATRTVEGASAAAVTPSSTVHATPAIESATTSSPGAPLPVPSTSQQLAAAIASPSATNATTTNATTASPSLAPAASIDSPFPPSPSPSSSPNSSRSSGKVIASLTAQLSETQSLLEATRTALAAAKAQSAVYQASADEMRSTLSRARLENDSSVTILARKDRQISEALERARKAEAEAKELGRASREWGTRIREVEEELGKERIKRSRAEQAYDTLGAEWKTARTRLVDEVQLLKREHKAAVDDLAQEYQKVLIFKDRLKHEPLATDPDSTTPPTHLVTQLTHLHTQMHTWITAQLTPLLTRLAQFEARENTEVMHNLQLLTDELTRIKTLMRRGDVRSKDDVPAGPF